MDKANEKKQDPHTPRRPPPPHDVVPEHSHENRKVKRKEKEQRALLGLPYTHLAAAVCF